VADARVMPTGVFVRKPFTLDDLMTVLASD
jgi:hypothetical protein